MKKLRIGVVGCGGIFRWAHRPAYLKMEDVEIVALCDIIRERAESFVAEFPGAEVYENYEELIAREDIDAIDICTPNYLHPVIACAAMEAGKHVFSEKPDSPTVEGVLAMKETSEKTGKVLMVMRNNRYVPASVFARKYIQDGEAGEIYAAHCGWQRRRGIPGKGGWFTTKAKSGGGPLIDLGVHMIDLALWLMGNPKPVAVTGCTYSKFAGNSLSDSANSDFGDKAADGVYDVEDLAMGFVRMDNGACLTIECSWASNVEEERRFVELYGTKAGLKWDTEKLTLFEERGGTLMDTKPKLPSVSLGHEMNLRHFVDVVLRGAEPKFLPEQGVDMVKLICALYESAKTGKEVQL
ncbi:MAG: Gfo/Idh/MocA family oxidoreductase [Clostridia bacterium]|nr:Gfo/Idh/MocA family oxidoreductase [Clostridia bacterium]